MVRRHTVRHGVERVSQVLLRAPVVPDIRRFQRVLDRASDLAWSDFLVARAVRSVVGELDRPPDPLRA